MNRNAWACVAFASLVSFASFAEATEAELGVVEVETVAVVARQFGLHKAGNLEVKIKGGIALPSWILCDRNYLTTTAQTDADGMLFAMLSSKSRRFSMRITDSSVARAYPRVATPGVESRCSIVAVSMSPIQ